MKKIIYPGTFDPIHCGHIDIAERASRLFDKLIFVVADNADKNTLFTPDQRIDLILDATKHISNTIKTNKSHKI